MESLFGEDRVDVAVEKLHQIRWTEGGVEQRWPADYGKDRQMIEKIMIEKPGKDLTEELERFARWMSKQNFRKKVNPRGRINTWLCSDERWANSPKPGAGGQRGRGARSTVGGAPAPSGAFRESGVISL